jgi:hypothetical protein
MSKLPDEAFRDTIGTIDDEGKRKFIFLKAVGKILWLSQVGKLYFADHFSCKSVFENKWKPIYAI